MRKNMTRILVMGASGMLGSTLFRFFSRDPDFATFGTVRDHSSLRFFSSELHGTLLPSIHLEGELGILSAISIAKPDIVINCIGIIKQLPDASNHLESLAINATLPHRLAKYCDAVGARLIHFSTDCVFSGRQGMYTEDDFPDACDLYGRTKLLGEVDYKNTITLRTSIIGHELNRAKSLIDWFLVQSGEVQGFVHATFSGLPAIEIARVVKTFVIPNHELSGLYHLSVEPINKFDLLNLVAQTYKKDILINPNGNLVIDRSLNSDRFKASTGFKSRPWPDLINDMYQEYLLTN
jgi:dTDP-4-dehydrorhamnose reductase